MCALPVGRPLHEVFDEFGEAPAAAASLAQVYRARLRSTGEWVAVKVQRPGVQALVSKDLYVLRRAAEIYQGLVSRFAPQQRTDYVALFNEWAVGFYTELDFKNEGANMDKMRELLDAQGVRDVWIPAVSWTRLGHCDALPHTSHPAASSHRRCTRSTRAAASS